MIEQEIFKMIGEVTEYESGIAIEECDDQEKPVCPSCSGTGTSDNEGTRTCRNCGGTGEVD